MFDFQALTHGLLSVHSKLQDCFASPILEEAISPFKSTSPIQRSFPLPHDPAFDLCQLGIALHNMEHLVFWWFDLDTLVVAFEPDFAEEGFAKCRNLVNGN